MVIILYILIVVYFFVVIRTAKKLVGEDISLVEGDIADLERRYQRWLDKKEKCAGRKIELDIKVAEVFTLYEITKDITKSLNEEEAFQIFKEKLKKYLGFIDCQLLTSAKDIEAFKNQAEHFIFPLMWKKEALGCLAFDGMFKEAEERIKILCQQFVLAFRRVKLYREIEKIATTDSLTEVHTRRHALDRKSVV